jgi:Arc/MetJ family transcription regulator
MPRTTLEIDDRLLAAAKKATGESTTKGVVNEGLKLLVRQNKLKRYASLRGSGLSELTREELELIRRDE